MGIMDWSIVGIVIVALILAITYTLRHKEKCLGCGGDCTHCSKGKKQRNKNIVF